MADFVENPSVDVFSRRWLLIVIACMVPPILLFASKGDIGRGRAAAVGLAVTMTAVRACWDLRKHVWFWLLVVAILGIHSALVLLVPWSSDSYPGGYAILPFAVVDYGIVYGSFKLAEKLMKRS